MAGVGSGYQTEINQTEWKPDRDKPDRGNQTEWKPDRDKPDRDKTDRVETRQRMREPQTASCKNKGGFK
jgi:hypothetical protein